MLKILFNIVILLVGLYTSYRLVKSGCNDLKEAQKLRQQAKELKMPKVKKYSKEEAYQRQIDRVNEYNRTHKKEAYRNQKKSRARNFIKKDATREELEELRGLIDERLKEL